MRPIKVIEESNEYLVSVADYIYRLSTQHAVDKQDRDLLESYADELMEIQKRLEGMKQTWVIKQEHEKKMLEEEKEVQTGKEKI